MRKRKDGMATKKNEFEEGLGYIERFKESGSR
jgi:hypothetical protein